MYTSAKPCTPSKNSSVSSMEASPLGLLTVSILVDCRVAWRQSSHLQVHNLQVHKLSWKLLSKLCVAYSIHVNLGLTSKVDSSNSAKSLTGPNLIELPSSVCPHKRAKPCRVGYAPPNNSSVSNMEASPLGLLKVNIFVVCWKDTQHCKRETV